MRNLHRQVAQPLDDDTIYIYGLVDPRTEFVRYVGKARDPKRRYAGHLIPSQLKKVNHRTCWLRGLLAEGLKPTMIIIEKVKKSEWKESERKWIAYYRNIPNYPALTNICDGGEGIDGYVATEEVRRRIADSHRGVPMPAGHGEKVRAAHKGRKHTEQSRANMSRGGQERWNKLSEKDKQKWIVDLHSHRKRRGTNHSQFMGVTLVHNKYWSASASVNGIKKYIGSFEFEEDAAHARDKYVLKHIGENAVLNFPRAEYGNDIVIEKPKNRQFGPRALAANSTSGYKGVHWHKQALKWQAGVCYQGRYFSAGMFKDKFEAARAHDRKAIELFGDKAVLNFARSSYD
jgi:hypothetical protein